MTIIIIEPSIKDTVIEKKNRGKTIAQKIRFGKLNQK